MAIRDFIIRTLFNDNGAKDELQSTLDLAQQLVENAWEINIDADTGGVDALVASVDQLGETEQETQSITGYLSDMFESLKGTAEGVSESYRQHGRLYIGDQSCCGCYYSPWR